MEKHAKFVSLLVDFYFVLDKNRKGRFLMKSFLKFLFSLIFVSSAFFLGFHLGKEKEKQRIPKFQDDLDRTE